MNSVQLLDASLRDGGHRTNFHFSDEQLRGILQPLDNTGIEFIEIGYRNGSLHPIKNIGRAGITDRDYLLFCQSLIKKSTIAVMAHPNNINENDLLELKNCGVGMLRICIAKNKLAEAVPVIKLAQKLKLMVSVNFIHMTYYTDEELDEVVEQVCRHKPDVIYFADSNGSILPQRIKAIYERYTTNYSIPFGFHAHDNIGLAQSNALAALDAGVEFIDASLAGMGKGTGNLKTEFFIACLHANKVQKYDLHAALTASNYVRDALNIGHEAIEMDEFIRGISDYSTADLKALPPKTEPGR
ncbi:4-hydroxy-2-oxovalerate aldolase [Legionella worsleiensis]|uniref:4-hydroxy-2-oxovalerate aldolase n=1 Tax=Legionella worsleiensis TaxID=45076 RepID=A0A0W1AFG6_9GAMM|nr:4-hydroxy-2-oxovalerate aldolase [Legionella worsleiensis]KTD80004.1 4-hydroxy-2-oxovalerate aldolase [Legionella worsleiensis]STY32476.1 4-hydroxy-2-ketovalerate aldolase [Legionella worsleiensis]